ncbi:MAG: DUF748 domain-containing protein [Nitrospiraceae bacterium]|jgi:hypothetical protein|uniref:DUF748 domain-containing protein n=1 Tax=Nitrospira cf. moscoviensis SBR1015 TaxID=96242 RepID=UPI000A0C0B1E|nr:DUF748 domain-containing protein [Nitrospira cf. moscoviensis SBR1015]MBY0246946.1 DUF748 domain-containing protein [Nitrospiraceae bacterium]OQW36330.1 MAG: hypothetical protein A4E20_07470 [Nitrospira sp. SG-bin2]
MRQLIRPRLLAGLVVGLVGLYALVGFVLLPYLIKEYGVPAASEQLQHPVVVRDVAFNPFTLALRLNGLEVREQDQTPIIGFEEFVVNLRATTLFFQTLGFDEIRLVMPFVAARVNREGKLNLLGLVPSSDKAAAPVETATGEPKRMMPLEIGLLEIDNGIVEFRDESKAKPISMDIVPIQITLRNFSTTQGSDNAYAFTAEIGKGEALAWEGTVSLEPVESDGKVSLSGVKLKTLYQAVQDRFQFDMQQGELALSATYHFDLRGQAPRATVKDGRLAVRGLAIGERGLPEPLVSIPVADVEGIQFDLEKRSIRVEKVHTADARFDAWMDVGGVVNLQQLFAPAGSSGEKAAEPVSANKKTVSEPWTVGVDVVEIENYQAKFEDRTLTTPGVVEVGALDVTVKDVQIPFTKPLPVSVSLTLNRTGHVDVRGQVAVEPMKADLEIKITQIAINPFQPYLDRFLDADIREGAIDLNGSVQYAKEHPKGPMLRFQGNLAVNQLLVTDRKEFEDVGSWKSLAFNRVALDVEPTTVRIGEILLQEPAVQAVMESDGSLNLSKLLVASPSGGAQGEPAKDDSRKSAAKTDPLTIIVDQVKLVKATAIFRDLSVEPSVKTGVTDFGGTIKGLSSKQIKKADVDLAGKIDRAAPLKIVGKINPLSEDAFTDLVITLQGMDVTPAGPYSGKFAGYGLSKGKLSLDLKYKVSQQILEAENLVSIDQLTFGQKVESPDATSLPVPLLVALLQDRKGLIEIDLPIRGDLNDPDFKYGKVVISTLLNLLGKVVASPFSLLGKLVPDGGGGDDLQFVEFQPGSAVLADDGMKKLDVLEQALDERAGLRLDIKGTSDAVVDGAALRKRKLMDRLMTKIRRERGKSAGPVEISAEEEQRFVEELFAELLAKQAGMSGKAPDQAESTPPTAEEMKERVLAEIPITDADLEFLAMERGEAVRTRLLENGKLGSGRVFLLEAGAADPGHERVRTQLVLGAG